MKKLLIIYMLFLPMLSMAQAGEAHEKIEAARIALITERLELTPEQAEKFWPIYREFADKRQEIHRELRDLRRESGQQELDDAKSKELMSRAMALKERELDLEKTYSDRMMRVISAQQLMSLKKAEDDFRRMILQQLERRRDQRMQQQDMQNRREEYLKDKRGN